MARSEALKRAQKKYDAEKTIHYGIKLNRNTDRDIIKWLDTCDSKQTSIKHAIRYYLNNR